MITNNLPNMENFNEKDLGQKYSHARFVFEELNKFQRLPSLSGIELTSQNASSSHAQKLVLSSSNSSENQEFEDSIFYDQHEVMTPQNIIRRTHSLESQSSSDSDVDEDVSCLQGLDMFNQLRLDGSSCDIQLYSAESQHGYSCHRCVLAACSEYFRAMFTANMIESHQKKIHIQEIGEELEQIIEFFYTGEIDLKKYDVIHLLEVAVYYQISSLIQRCVDHICDNINLENCCSFTWIGHELSLKKLTQVSLDYVSNHFDELHDKNIEVICFTDLIFCLNNLKFKENQVLASEIEFGILKSLLNWCQGNMEQVENHNEVIKNARFALIPKSKIQQIYSELKSSNNSLLSSPAVADWITKALDYHDNLYNQPLMQNEETQLRNSELKHASVDGVLSSNRLRFQQNSSNIFIANQSPSVSLEDSEAPRDPFHSVVELNGFLYVLGGTRKESTGFSRLVDRYDPRLDQWIRVAPMIQERADFVACVLNGYIIVAGGRCRRGCLKTCERYDPKTNSWTNIAKLPEPMYMASGVVCRGSIYISGGFNDYEVLDDMIRYDEVADKWMKSPGRMFKSRGYHVTIESPEDGRIWAIGGVDNPFAGRNVWEVEAYNVETGRWNFVSHILAVKPFTSTMRLNVMINNQKRLCVFPVSNLNYHCSVEYNSDSKMWLENHSPSTVYEIDLQPSLFE